ncbi:hypothetical protein GWI33_023088 [Rhynchophorus ferrugineus]|uniref:RNase H type-1 domain-containing protein n=1 Tax=Rhynchophorus ferrugineus TaxID=354439 RepID=A0A834IY44_RHYFE|nr:hypothetical protein GWI33_023088 [Rhynchophorus ferrugineus]
METSLGSIMEYKAGLKNPWRSDSLETEQNEIGRHIAKVWTDARVKQEKAGAGIFIRRSDGTEEEACMRLENGINSRVAEFLAKQEAIRILEEHGDMHAVIKTDSRATVWQLENDETKIRPVDEVQKVLRERAARGIKTEISWEKRLATTESINVDQLAKAASEKNQTDKNGLGWTSKITARKEKKKWILQKWQRYWDECTNGRNTYKLCKTVGFERLELNRKAVQLITNHGNMEANIKRFRLKITEAVCGCSQDSHHE